jgi:hypothetical protein
MATKLPSSHPVAVAQIWELANELAYDVQVNCPNAPGPDLRIVNPKTKRQALVEVEVTFQQQKSHQRKYKKRHDALNAETESGREAVLLVIGAKRRDLVALLKRAGVANAGSEYGTRIFNAVRSRDQGEIRAVLLRCLGGA